MSYGYDTYDNYPPYEYAQPPHELNIHPNSAVAQLGLTQEEAREVLADQERWFQEEYQQVLEDRAEVRPEYQVQEQHTHNGAPSPTPTADPEPEPEYNVYKGYGMVNEPPETTTSLDDNNVINCGDVPTTRYHPPTPILDGTDPTPRHEHSGYDMANKYNEHVILFDGYEPNNGANMEPEHDRAARMRAHRLGRHNGGLGRGDGRDWIATR
jgi:hypothetical protein